MSPISHSCRSEAPHKERVSPSFSFTYQLICFSSTFAPHTPNVVFLTTILNLTACSRSVLYPSSLVYEAVVTYIISFMYIILPFFFLLFFLYKFTCQVSLQLVDGQSYNHYSFVGVTVTIFDSFIRNLCRKVHNGDDRTLYTSESLPNELVNRCLQ